MRRVFALALAAWVSSVALPAHAKVVPGCAPADEYFGRLHASILEIRNRLDRMEMRSDRDMRDRRIASELKDITDEVADWQEKYPRDPWLPRMRMRLMQSYHRAGEPAAPQIAVDSASKVPAEPKYIGPRP